MEDAQSMNTDVQCSRFHIPYSIFHVPCSMFKSPQAQPSSETVAVDFSSLIPSFRASRSGPRQPMASI